MMHAPLLRPPDGPAAPEWLHLHIRTEAKSFFPDANTVLHICMPLLRVSLGEASQGRGIRPRRAVLRVMDLPRPPPA